MENTLENEFTENVEKNEFTENVEKSEFTENVEKNETGEEDDEDLPFFNINVSYDLMKMLTSSEHSAQ